nr:immunoglobulin light chain junction region [Macaca mulatta]
DYYCSLYMGDGVVLF